MDIKSEILDYVRSNETTGALLITGPWGCGKSYLMKEIADELNREKTAAISVISLFGIESIIAINKRISKEYATFKVGAFGKKTRKIVKSFTKLAKEGIEIAKIAEPLDTGLSAVSQGFTSLLNFDISDFFEVQSVIDNNGKRKFVIVFDDLERCGISNKQDLYGTINEYIENKGIKVIIVANDDKINGQEFKQYNEKIISRIVRMNNDYEDLVKVIIENYKETDKGYRDFLKENINLLTDVFFESKTYNLRIFKHCIYDFERIYRAWNESNITTENMKWVLYTFCAEKYDLEANVDDQKITEKKEVNPFLSKITNQYKNKGKHNSEFTSLNIWIKKGIWDKDLFAKELSEKYVGKNETPYDRVLAYDFWDMEQEDIDEGLPQAILRAYDGELSKDNLLSILYIIHLLKENNIKTPVEIDYHKMKTGLECRIKKIAQGIVTEPQSVKHIDKNNIDMEAEPLYELLEKLDNKLITIENKSKYIKYLSGDEDMPRNRIQSLIMEEFDDELLEAFISRYSVCNNSEKRDIASSLLKLSFDSSEYSSNANVEKTKHNFHKLIQYLKRADNTNQVASVLNKYFINDIKGKYELK